MTRRTTSFLAVGAILLGTVSGCRQPKPTYEYGETETTITTTPPRGRAVVTTSTVAPQSPTAPQSPSGWKRGEAR